MKQQSCIPSGNRVTHETWQPATDAPVACAQHALLFPPAARALDEWRATAVQT